jgi:hypothetical protein
MRPPSIVQTCPVTKDASDEASHATRFATSSGLPVRPTGWILPIERRNPSGSGMLSPKSIIKVGVDPAGGDGVGSGQSSHRSSGTPSPRTIYIRRPNKAGRPEKHQCVQYSVLSFSNSFYSGMTSTSFPLMLFDKKSCYAWTMSFNG